MIEINALDKTFNKNKRNALKALDNISITLPQSGIVAIFGKSGSGKSTLLNMLGGLDSFDSGTIKFDDKTYTKCVDDAFRIENIGYIFQNYLLDPRINVYENVARGLRSIGVNDEEVIFTRVMTALKNVDMQQFFKRKIDTLSGGQQQRVAIARAMVKGAKIILADEPTGNLDEQNTRMIMDILKEMSKNCLVILVTHEQDIIDCYADSVIEIKDGKILSTNEGQKSHSDVYDKVNIFLGDLEKQSVNQDGINFELYGKNDLDINLKIINTNGKYYLSCDHEVIIVNKHSEIQIHDTSKEEFIKERQKQTTKDIDTLGHIQPKSTGSIFDFASSYKEGLKTIFSKKAKLSKLFFATLVLFSIAIIVMTAIIGSVYGAYKDVEENYSINYVNLNFNDYAQIDDVVEVAKDYGYKYHYIYKYNNILSFSINPNNFESVTLAEKRYINCNFYDRQLLENATLLHGSKEITQVTDIVLSESLAEDILDTIKQSYNLKNVDTDYLINLNMTYAQFDCRIIGVVKGDQDFCYIDEMLFYSELFREYCDVVLDELYGLDVPDGMVIRSSSYVNQDYYILGKKFQYYEIEGDTPKDIYQYYVINRNELELAKSRIGGELNLKIYAEDSAGLSQKLQSMEYVTAKSNHDYAQMDKLDAKIAMTETLKIFLLLIAVMCLCILLLGYTTIATRTKEFAIYRCIGVSKKNVLFKLFCESISILTTAILPVFVVLGIIFMALTYADILFTLTWWIWLIATLIVSVLIVCTYLLPSMLFWRKTPIQLLTKYDL